MNKLMRRLPAFGAAMTLLLATLPVSAGSPPVFSKQFLPFQIGSGNTSRLLYTIDNIGSNMAVIQLAFDEALPPGLIIDDPLELANTCGGIVRATPGGDSISLRDGRVAALDSCILSLNVTATGNQPYVATSSDLTSDAGNSGNSSAMLTSTTTLPALSLSFTPMTVAAGDIANLTYVVDNTLGIGSFNFDLDIVPQAGTSVADPANVSNDCFGTLAVGPRNERVQLTSGFVAMGTVCSVSFDVQTTYAGRFPLVPRNVVTNGGEIGFPVSELEVIAPTLAIDKRFDNGPPGEMRADPAPFPAPAPTPAGLPIFSLDISPPVVTVGAPATVTLTFDNTLQGSNSFVDFFLPFTDGLVVATDPNVSQGCAMGLAATPPNTAVSSSLAIIPAASVCTGTFDVVATRAGVFRIGNSAGTYPEFTATGEFRAEYGVAPGTTANLVFDIHNLDRADTALNLTFSDDLNAMLPGATAVGLPLNDVCGAGSVVSGSTTVNLTSGQLAANSGCTFAVSVAIPAAAAGEFLNMTSNIEGDVGVRFVSDPGAEADLLVGLQPQLTKTFLTSPAVTGSGAIVEFTLTNPSASDPLSQGQFTDPLSDLTTVGNVVIPAPGFCGPGSSASVFTHDSLPHQAQFRGLELAPGASCTFSYTVNLPLTLEAGDISVATSSVGALIAGAPVGGEPASDTLTVVAGPTMTMTTSSLLAAPGGTIDLTFDIAMNDDDMSGASSIGFMVDLGAALTGLSAVGLPMMDVCGAGSSITGTTMLTFSDGQLGPAGSCQFTITLQIPPAATTSDVVVDGSSVVAQVAGLATTSIATSVGFGVTEIALSLEIMPPVAVAGDMVTFSFEVDNSANASAIDFFSFMVDLNNFIPGATKPAGSIPMPCGGSSSVGAQTNAIALQFGTLAANASCNFDVMVQIPPGAAPGDYIASIGDFVAVTGGNTISGLTASAGLTIAPQVEVMTAIANANAAGDITQISYTLTSTGGAMDVSLDTDLDAALSGLATSGVLPTNPCGAGSSLTGGDTITLGNASIAAMSSCNFSVDLQIPLSAAPGDYSIQTSPPVAGATLGGFGTQSVLEVRAGAPLIANMASVQAEEGQLASNSGSFAPSGSGIVTLSASLGQVVDNGDRTWDWSYTVNDGPDDSQMVTIFSTTNRGGGVQDSVSFQLDAINVVPGVVARGLKTFTPISPYTLTLVEIVDPGDDSVTQIEIDWGDGNSSVVGGLGDVMHTYSLNDTDVTVRISLTDEDGTHSDVLVFTLFNSAEVPFYDSFEDELNFGNRVQEWGP